MFKMKWSKYLLCGTTLFLFVNIFSAKAQLAPLDSLLVRALTTDELLPMLIDSAIKFSPEVSRLNNTIIYNEDNLKMSKKNIYNILSLNSSYNYGTNFSAVNNPSAGGATFTKAQTGYYLAGISFQLPLAEILNRKSSVHSAKALVNAAKDDKQKAALSIKQEVITLYQDLKLNQKLTIVSGKAKESAQINYSIAEKDFIQGQTSVEQIARIQDILTKALEEFETYYNRFQTSYMQLEAYTGTNLSTLIKQVK
jgi:outer membrane protein TolC